MGEEIRGKYLRKWKLMFFLGPGLFFLFYLMIVQGTSESPSQKISLPDDYYLPGQVVHVDGIEIQAGLTDGNIVTGELVIAHNNRVMAESGKIFLIIPVYSSDYEFQADDFTLLDTGGVQYSPLDIDNQYILRAVQQNGGLVSSEVPVYYLLFKVKDKVEGYYLIMQKDDEKIVWYFKR